VRPHDDQIGRAVFGLIQYDLGRIAFDDLDRVDQVLALRGHAALLGAELLYPSLDLGFDCLPGLSMHRFRIIVRNILLNEALTESGEGLDRMHGHYPCLVLPGHGQGMPEDIGGAGAEAGGVKNFLNFRQHNSFLLN